MTIKNQKSLLINIAGIALSLLISFGVWGAVVFLIENNERELLRSNTVSENIMLITGEGSRGKTYITAEIFEVASLPNHMIRNLLKYLSEGELIEWEASEVQIAGVDAEEKIDSFTRYLTNCGFLKSGVYQHDMKIYGFAGEEDVRKSESYLFWKGISVSSDYTLTYVINAESGGIWYAEIVSNAGGFEFNGIVPENLLAVYETYLGYPNTRPIYFNEKSAYRVYGNNFVSNVEVDGNRIVMRLLPY